MALNSILCVNVRTQESAGVQFSTTHHHFYFLLLLYHLRFTAAFKFDIHILPYEFPLILRAGIIVHSSSGFSYV